MRWPAPGQTAPEPAARPPGMLAMRRGLAARCPACGEGRLFAGYLRVAPQCAHCATPLGLLRADDAPPYIVILLVGHLLVPPMLWLDHAVHPPLWLHFALWLPAITLVSLGLLRPVKGALIGWMVAQGMWPDPAEPPP